MFDNFKHKMLHTQRCSDRTFKPLLTYFRHVS